MTQQEVIKAFMARLANHGYSATYATATNMLDAAVTASSRFTSIQNVIESMEADQATCEANAIKTVVTAVLGKDWYNTNCLKESKDENNDTVYTSKTLSELEETLNAITTDKNNQTITASTVSDYISGTYSNLSNVIREVTANDFLKNCCGIILDNDDTGAITGNDAGGSDIKTADSVVPETWINTYIATTNQAQKITTGNRDWVVKATAANDTINSGGADSINAGTGNDEINIVGNGATVTAGAGEDNISISSDVKKVTITDLTAEDTLTIAGSFEVGAAKIEDMMLVITDKTGTRKITLGDFENAKGGNVNLNGASKTIAKWLTDSGINLDNLENTTYAASVGVTPAETTETSTSTDAAVETHDVSGTVEVNLADYLTASEGNVTQNSETVGTLSSSFPNASTFTRNGLTVHLLGESSQYAPTTNGTSNITAKTYDELTDDQKAIVGALFKWWGSETLKLNEESYGISFTSDNAKVTDIGLYFYNASSNTLAAVWNWQRITDDGEATQLMLNVNMNYYSGISSNEDKAKVMNGDSSGGYLDRTLAHEMTHAVMASNINYFSYLPQFIKEGIAELTHGIDDERGNVIFQIAYDTNRLASALDVASTSTGQVDAYAGGYMFMRYFAKQAAAQTENYPALGEISVDVDFGNLQNLANGNILYVDTTQETPTVQVADTWDDFLETEDPNNSLLNIGEVYAGAKGKLYYQVSNNLVKQNITTSAAVPQVYGVNANTTVTGAGEDNGIQIVEGNTKINTGDGVDAVQVTGQYATIDTGAGNDVIYIYDGAHHNINLGDGNNILRIEGLPNYLASQNYFYTRSDGNTITGGAGIDSITNGFGLAAYDANGNIYYADQVEGTDNNYYVTTYYFDEESGEYNTSNTSVTVLNFYVQNDNYQMDLGDGDNIVDLYYLKDSTLKTGTGGDLLNFSGLDNSYIDAGDGDDSLSFGGDSNSIYGGAGNDSVLMATNNGKNIFIYDSDFGADTIQGFSANDKIQIAKGYTYEVSEIQTGTYSNNGGSYQELTVTIKGGDAEKGTIKLITGSNQTFAADKNIYNSGTASENIEYNVTEKGRTITLTDDVIDVIYIDATAFTDTENLGTVTFDGTLGEDDQIIVYIGNKTTNPADVTVKQDGTAALINVTHNSTNYAIKVVNAFSESITLGDTVSENHTLDGTYTKTGIASNATNAYILEYKTETKNLTLNGVKDTAGITADGTTITVNTSSIYTESADAKGTVKLTTDADITLAVTGEDLGELSAGWTLNEQVATYSDVSKKGYIVDGKSIKYNNAEEHDKKLTISDLKDGVTTEQIEKAVSVSGTTVTINSADILPSSGEVTISDGFTLALGEGITNKSESKTETLTQDNETKSKYTYTSAGDTAGYKVESSKIVYKENSVTSFTIEGLKDGAALNKDLTVTEDATSTEFKFKASALNKENVAITTSNSGAFTVALDNDVDTEGETISEDKAISDGVLNYTAAGTGEFYTKTDTGVTYTAQVGGETIKISDLNTAATEATGVTVTKTGEAFTIKFTDKDLLNKKNPTITTISKYTVEVDDAVKPTEQALAWNVSGTKATLRADTSDGYTVKDNAISYSESVAGASEMEISGVVSNAEIAAPTDENKVVTLTAENLRDEASITSNEGNYTVKLTNDMKGKTFTGTSGADTIEVAANNAAVYGGAGVDSIAITGTSVTVDGGAGADTISIDGSASAMIIFNENSDSDIIQGYKATDTIKVAGSNYDTSESGNDILLSFGGNTLTLKDAKGTELTINKVRTADTFQTGITMKNDALTASNKFTDDAIDLSEYPDTIKKLNASAVENALTITATNTKGTSISGGKGADTIIGSTGNDTLKGNDGADVYIYGGGEDLIYYAEEDKIQLDFEKVESSTLKGSDAVLTLKDDGGTITLKSVKNKTITFVNGENETQKIFFNDTYYAPLEDGLTYNYSRTALTADSVFADTEIDLKNYLNTVTKVNFAAATQGVSITGNTENTANVSITGSAYNDTITGGNVKNVVKGGAGNDEITGGTSDDKLQGEAGDDTLSGGTGKNTLYGGAGKDVFVIGGNDFIYDYNADDDVIRMNFSEVTDTTLSGSNAILTLKDNGGTVTIKGAKNKTITFQDDSGAETQKIFYANTSYDPLENGLIYNSARNKLTADSDFEGYEINLSEYLSTVTKVDASTAANSLTITGSTLEGALAVSISGGTNGDEITGTDKADTIKGGAGADVINGGEGNNRIFGDEGDDTLTGGAGNDTFKGGAGNDVINGGDGNNRIFGDDGDDILNGGEGNDTFKGGNGNDEIHGNAGDNRIFGDAGDDILYGGTGNSTLTGGAGNDIFVYEGGKDLITDYTAGEEIQLSGSYTVTENNYEYSGKNLVFKFNADNTLTIKNAKNKTITINGNSQVYTVSKANAQTYDLLYDNNFTTDEFGIDDITETKFEVTNIETQNNLEIAQEDKTLITFTGSRQ